LLAGDEVVMTKSGKESAPKAVKAKDPKPGRPKGSANQNRKYVGLPPLQGGIRARVYQAQAWHSNFPGLLNVAVIVKTNLKTGRTAKALLFRDDLALAAETLIEY
jgi:hypothetical protein